MKTRLGIKILLTLFQTTTLLASADALAWPHIWGRRNPVLPSSFQGNFHEQKLSEFGTQEDVASGLRYNIVSLWGMVLLDEETNVILPDPRDPNNSAIEISHSAETNTLADCKFLQRNRYPVGYFEKFNEVWFTEPVLVLKYRDLGKQKQARSVRSVKLKAGAILSIEKIVPYGDGVTGEIVLSHKSGLFYSVICQMGSRSYRNFSSLKVSELEDLLHVLKLDMHSSIKKARVAVPPKRDASVVVTPSPNLNAPRLLHEDLPLVASPASTMQVPNPNITMTKPKNVTVTKLEVVEPEIQTLLEDVPQPLPQFQQQQRSQAVLVPQNIQEIPTSSRRDEPVVQNMNQAAEVKEVPRVAPEVVAPVQHKLKFLENR